MASGKVLEIGKIYSNTSTFSSTTAWTAITITLTGLPEGKYLVSAGVIDAGVQTIRLRLSDENTMGGFIPGVICNETTAFQASASISFVYDRASNGGTLFAELITDKSLTELNGKMKIMAMRIA